MSSTLHLPDYEESFSEPSPAETWQRFFVGWKHPVRRRMVPVGVLDRVSQSADIAVPVDSTEGLWRFSYTQGALDPAFVPIAGLSRSLDETTLTEQLFPFFQQRIMTAGRPDRPDYLTRLGLPVDASDLDVLARSFGRRTTDEFQVVGEPAIVDGRLQLTFFVHGIRHVEGGEAAVVQMHAGDPLLLRPEKTNPVNDRALIVANMGERPLGWVPDLLVETAHRAAASDPDYDCRVVHVNDADSGLRQRLLTTFTALVPSDFTVFEGLEWLPLGCD
jgi:hypothetical protein